MKLLPSGAISSIRGRLLARFGIGGIARPTQVHLSVTDRCFLPCLHCDIHRSRSRDLPGEAWASAIDRLGAWMAPAGANFVGGEPLLRDDLEALMLRATRLGFTVTFNTNGFLLDRERSARIADSGATIAYLSLDGIKAETVDYTRNQAGVFERTQKALANLEAHRSPRVVITTILHGRNAAEIPELLEFTLQRGHQLVVQPLYQNFGAATWEPRWYRSSPLWPADPGPVCEALDLLIAARQAERGVCNSVEQLSAMKAYFRAPAVWNGLRCRAGSSDLAIDPQGGLRLCFMREPVGSILDGRDLARTWEGGMARRRREEIGLCTRSCNLLNCNFERP